MTDPPSPSSPPMLSVRGLRLAAGGRTLVSELDLDLWAGDRLVLVGGNGAGKSTLLSVLAGLTDPAAGRVQLPDMPPGMLFQDGALWPHMTVAEHLAFADPRGNDDWRRRLLATFDLDRLSDRRPEQLSGGERLRLGLARALAGRPRLVLLDEPLAHLDPGAAAHVRECLPPLLDELGAAAITVTHDPDDVLLFGDQLLALSGDGRWWLGPARFALESCPTGDLAAFSARGTVLTGQADATGRVDLGLKLRLTGLPPGRTVRAFLDAAAVFFGDPPDAPDERPAPEPPGDEAATEAAVEARDDAPPEAPDVSGVSVAAGDAVPAAAATRAEHGQGLYIAPDRRGGSWVRVDGILLRCGESRGDLRPGDAVSIRIVGQPRVLDHVPTPGTNGR